MPVSKSLFNHSEAGLTPPLLLQMQQRENSRFADATALFSR